MIKECCHGHGLFAKKNFKKGESICVIVGGKIVRNCSEASMYALKIPGRKMWWDEIKTTKPECDSFLDHNEEPNAMILFKEFNPKNPKANLIAIENIKRNDEITINYHEYEDNLYKAKRYRLPFKL